MLERITIRNFKRFAEVEVELGQRVLLIGPNNAGKSSALEALTLWELGVRRWNERRRKGSGAKQRTGVAINRRDILAVPVPECRLLWRDRHVRDRERRAGRQVTSNVRMEIVVAGVSAETRWECGLEFDFANSESVYCRPLGARDDDSRLDLPEPAGSVRVAFLQSMSGLAATEDRLDPGAIQVRLGEGRTAEVLRNLCWALYQERPGDGWESLREQMEALFGVDLEPPEYVPERGEITMAYREPGGTRLDLSSAGRGMQQTLLLLSYLHTNPGAVVLLDEPDAHLEILRQRQIYEVLGRAARESDSQIIAASHSEVLLNEAAGRDVVIAFVGTPHRIDDRGSQVLKALTAIGFDHYYQAEQTGWVLYLEGSTDLAILQAFAETLEHPAREHLARPFVHYVGNQLSKAKEHFYGLREAVPGLRGLAILDRQEGGLPEAGPDLEARCWSRREIENYLCMPEVLEAFARAQGRAEAPGPLFETTEADERAAKMHACVTDQVPPAAMRDRAHAWWRNVKASDELLAPVFTSYFQRLDLPNLMQKSSYHELAHFVPREQIDDEIVEVLDRIVAVAAAAAPLRGEER